jgi:hypothetical protein
MRITVFSYVTPPSLIQTASEEPAISFYYPDEWDSGLLKLCKFLQDYAKDLKSSAMLRSVDSDV